MTNLERLKVELNNQDYFTIEEYTMFLEENSLSATEPYDKATNQRNLLLTVLDILEAISNDINIMRRVESETLTTADASKYLDKRKADLRNRIACLAVDEEVNDNVSFLFVNTRGRRR